MTLVVSQLKSDISNARQLKTWLQGLSEEDRRTALLAFFYQETRRRKDPFYMVLPNPSENTVKSRNFKTFSTIRQWMEKVGWKITLSERAWQRYVNFVFDELCPESRQDALPPPPGQMKNPILLKRFLNEPDVYEKQKLRTDDQLKKLYELIDSRIS